MVKTLGKVRSQNAQKRYFAECFYHDTRQRLRFCRVSLSRHSAKWKALPSAIPSWHSANDAVTVFSPSTTFFLPRVGSALGKAVAECSMKSTRQRAFCRQKLCRVRYAVGGTRQSRCRVFIVLCRVPPALGKAAEPGSEVRPTLQVCSSWP